MLVRRPLPILGLRRRRVWYINLLTLWETRSINRFAECERHRRTAYTSQQTDYTLSIITAVMAVESYLTRLFLKLKGMANYAITFELPTESQEMEWEKEYPRSGGFKVPSDFVSQKLAGATFDKFVEGNAATATIFSGLPSSSHSSPAQYIQDRLFKQRNRIVHWGYVNSGKAEAEHCLEIAVVVVRILERMDKGTNWIELAQKMAEAARAGVAAERRHLHEILAERQQAESRE